MAGQKQLAEDLALRTRPSLSSRAKATARHILPSPLTSALGFSKRFAFDVPAMLRFLRTHYDSISFFKKVELLMQMLKIDLHVKCAHSNKEILMFCDKIFDLANRQTGVIVEAGCFKGGGTAKFSIACSIAQKRLVVFDSFQGLPENDEMHSFSIFGGSVKFSQGDYCGTLNEVKENVTRFGNIDACEFIAGFFSETMANFKNPILAAYLDVDLVSSARDCVRFLYPRIVEGGWLYSQDGHLPLILELLGNEAFWETDVGYPKPEIIGFGKSKVIRMKKSANL